MQPREDMVWLRQSESLEAAVDLLQRTGQARVVLVGRDLDDVLGILHLKDLFVAVHRNGDRPPLTRVARQPTFVRDDRPLALLISDWRRTGGSVSVVRDARGRVAGLIALPHVLRWLLADLESRDEPTPAGGDPVIGAQGEDGS
jgi:CBS domain containing-hemolysin-like protein